MKKIDDLLTFNKKYFFAFIVIFIIEILIGTYLKDQFIRGFIGDVLVVILIYCFCRTFINADHKKIAVSVFLFACSIEVLQAFNFVKLLGLQNNRLAAIVLGSTFDWKDILAYFIGFLICLKIK